ncbi:MAG: MATE family efflux transporter [Clostridiales bacterium]|nr:MATE family efflux transporter [Clostridiales bacterium]
MKKKENRSRDERLLNDPVEKVIPQMAIPTIISMLITSIYNMADTFFVSQIGTSASGAVGIIFSAMAMIQACSFMIGMGAGNNVSRILGSGHHELAKRFASTAWFTGFGFGCVIAILGQVYMRPLVMLLGSTETIAPYAMDYARYIFLAAPFMMCSLIMNNLLRLQGLAVYAMVGITTGGILNMVLDPIFIFGLGMGTAGAGLATGTSQVVSFCILLYMSNSRKETIHISLRNFRPSFRIYGDILYCGIPSLARQGVASVSTVVLNTIAGQYGDAAIAAMSIVSRYTMFINSVVVGFGQGFQPVCGFSFGAKKYARVKQAFWFCVKVATGVLLVLCLVSLVLSGNIVRVFRRDDAEVIAIGTFALRAQLCTMPLWGFYTMSNMFSQSIGYGVRATIISCARQGLFLVPVLLVLPRLFGLTGLQLSQPTSDVLSFILSVVLVTNILKELDRMSETDK